MTENEIGRGGLWELIRLAGHTPTTLAAELGCTAAAVCRWQAGINYPSINYLPRMAELLGVSVDDLVAVLISGGAGA